MDVTGFIGPYLGLGKGSMAYHSIELNKRTLGLQLLTKRQGYDSAFFYRHFSVRLSTSLDTVFFLVTKYYQKYPSIIEGIGRIEEYAT